MEKAKISYIKFFMFFFSIMLPCFVLNYLNDFDRIEKNWPISATIFLVGVSCLIIITLLYDKDKSDSIYVNADFFLYYIDQKEQQVEWGNLVVISTTKRWYLPVRVIRLGKKNDSHVVYDLYINYWTKEGLIEVIKKYAPKDHELYKKLAEIYPKSFKS